MIGEGRGEYPTWVTGLTSARRCIDRDAARPTYSVCFQSQLPSFQPVRHLSSHFEQSNSFFPNFRFTSL